MAEATADAPGRSMRRVAATALAGTSIEWFDFFLYGTAAALVFPTVFFAPDMPYFVSLIASFSTFAIGARPGPDVLPIKAERIRNFKRPKVGPGRIECVQKRSTT